MSEPRKEVIHTKIWREEPEPDNPFATKAAYCHGYDVYGQMVGNARWVEMLYLLFKGERPSKQQADLLEALAVAIANPGPRDPMMHAAMCGGVGGSTAAASLMAALAVGAGQLGGAREVYLVMQLWERCGQDISLWLSELSSDKKNQPDVWSNIEHQPGFDPHGVHISGVVLSLICKLTEIANDRSSVFDWLNSNKIILSELVGRPIAMSFVIATSFVWLGFTPDQGEMLCLLLRLPGAAAHALEQWEYGFKNFPFFSIELEDDPASSKEETEL